MSGNEILNKKVLESIQLGNAFGDYIAAVQMNPETKRLYQEYLGSICELREKLHNDIEEKEHECYEAEMLMKEKLKQNEATFTKNMNLLKEKKENQSIILDEKRNILTDISNKGKQNLNEQRKIKSMEKEIAFKENDNLVRDRATFALLTSTFNIKWDYSSGDKEVKGCIVHKKDLKPFSIDLNKYDKYYVADYLWDMMESL